MNHYKVNLYDHFGFDNAGSTEGNLFAYVQDTPPAISTTRRRPAILIIPGGGYSSTSNREAEPIAMPFLTAGYNAFILRYTCAPATFPVALREACMAMRYIRENADALEVNPNMIAAIGFSAGGHLCGTLGTMYDCPEVADLGDAALLRPDALCLGYPVAVAWGKTHEGTFRNISGGNEELRMRLSLDKLARADMPPTFLWHTRDDGGVPVRNSLILAQRLDELGVNFAMNIYNHGRHGLSTADEQVYNVNDMPTFSLALPNWLKDTLSFFTEMGFRITDPQ